MSVFSTPVSHGRFLSSQEVERRLNVQARLSSRLLKQVVDSYVVADYPKSALASTAYDEAQDRIASLHEEMRIANDAEVFLGRVAKANPLASTVTLACVEFGQDVRFVRVGRVNLDNHR